jgi:glycosyltransferase involved in cell wall biosynthesis
MPPSVCFILGELGPSGGAGAVVRHARGLAQDHGYDVSIALWPGGSPEAAAPAGVELVTIDEARGREHDIAIATWWRTAYDLFSVPARRHACFVQQFEERIYRPGDPERFGATVTHDLPVAFVTEAAWIAEQLADLRPDAACFHVPNGVDKQRFVPDGRSQADGPLRVLVEGSPGLWFKGVEDAAAALERTRERVETTLVTPEQVDPDLCARFDRVAGPLDHAAMAAAYREADVLLKLSRVEGVFTPPLEAFHCGTPCVVWPVTGHDEYVRHGVNGAVVDFDDLAGTAGWIDLLARDRALLADLARGALETAADWPSWDRSTAAFEAALREIADAPGPASGAGAARLLADLDAAMEEQRAALWRERHAAESARAWRDATQQELARAEATIVAFEQSRTWRYAAPLRRVGGRLRRLRARRSR